MMRTRQHCGRPRGFTLLEVAVVVAVAAILFFSLKIGEDFSRLVFGIGSMLSLLLIGAVVPFTLIGIMPTNHKLLAPGRDLGSAETRTLLERWGTLHAVRTTLSVLDTLLYIWLLLGA